MLAGHSLGGSVVTAYATWDFGGQAGADGLAGLIYDDGGSGPTPVTAQKAEESIEKLSKRTPWLAFGGIPAPTLGLFSAVGSTGRVVAPDAQNDPAGGYPNNEFFSHVVPFLEGL